MVHVQWPIVYPFPSSSSQDLYIVANLDKQCANSIYSWLVIGNHWHHKTTRISTWEQQEEWYQIRPMVENCWKALIASHKVFTTRDSLSYLLSDPLFPLSHSDSFVWLLYLCLCIENSSDSGTVWPMSKTSSAKGQGKSTRLRIVCYPQGVFLFSSTLYYHCRSGISFFTKTEHKKNKTKNTDILTILTISTDQTFYHVLTKEKTSSVSGRGVFYHLTLHLTQPGNHLLLLLLSPPSPRGRGVSKYNNDHIKFQMLK